MAAAVAAPSSACFSNSAARRRQLRSLNYSVLKASSSGFLPQYLCHFSDKISVTGIARRGDLTRIATAAAVVEALEGEAPAAAEEVKRVQNTKLYFGNLPYNCDGEQLAGIIQGYATPLSVEVLYDKDTGRSRGFAFVTMSTITACETVISNLNGTEYEGRILRVKFPEKWKGRTGIYQENEFKLFVGNLSWSVTSEVLKQVFKDYGSLVSARVVYDGETGRSRGYGFVCYSNKDEMVSAMEFLNGIELEGRALRVTLAISKKSPSIGEEGAK